MKDRKDPNNLQVRARVREDILAHFPDAQVFVAHGGDYRHRAVISKADVAAKIAEMILDINYDSHFKDVAIRTSPKSSSRMPAYYGAWTAFAKMQDYAPYSKHERGKEPKFKGGSWPTTGGYYRTDWDRWEREDARAANARSPKGSRPFSAYDLDADEFEPVSARKSSIADAAVMDEEDEEFYTQDELDAVSFYYDVSVDTLSDEKLAEYVKELNSMNMIPMRDTDRVTFEAGTEVGFGEDDLAEVVRAEADAEADYYGGITDYSDDDSNYALPVKRKSPHWWKRVFR